MRATLLKLIGCSGLLLLAFAHTPAQSLSDERPKLKKFGSSLDRLRWDPEKQAAIETKGPKAAPTVSGNLEVIRVQTDLVLVDTLVLDRQGRVITGLTQDDFIVTEDGGRQTIGHFSLGSDLTVPRSIVLIMDYSGSLRSYLNQSIDAAEVLIGQLGPKDKMALVTDDVKLLADFTGDRKKLKQALESLRRKAKEGAFGRSFQMTALMASVRELFDQEDIRPIVIFQTDGDEVGLLQPPDPRYYFIPEIPVNAPPALKKELKQSLGSLREQIESEFKPYSLKDVYKAVEKSRATVYTIIPGEPIIGIPAPQQYARVRSSVGPEYSDEQARDITFCIVRAQRAAAGAAMVSGGWTAFLNKPEQAGDIYSSILSDINSRYVIGYYPTNKIHDGRRRSISVEVRGHPDYVLSGRRSYYVPEPEQ